MDGCEKTRSVICLQSKRFAAASLTQGSSFCSGFRSRSAEGSERFLGIPLLKSPPAGRAPPPGNAFLGSVTRRAETRGVLPGAPRVQALKTTDLLHRPGGSENCPFRTWVLRWPRTPVSCTCCLTQASWVPQTRGAPRRQPSQAAPGLPWWGDHSRARLSPRSPNRTQRQG